ncbi:MAG TPA: nucleoside-diphosphate kinase [Dehalococcoidia bacterium]|nr:nucleoside-diphosphate kinase [Dehalococcoidia bacterium]
MNKSLVLIKPDAVQRLMIGKIISLIEERGLKITGVKMLRMNDDLALKLYSAHVDKPFFKELKQFMTSSPLVAISVEGMNAVAIMRSLMGTTNPIEAAPGTVRGDFAVTVGMNLIHGSDSDEAAEKEINLFFSQNELSGYSRDIDKWIN